MPQQHDYEESCHQLLCESRIRTACKTAVVQACLTLQGIAVVKWIMNTIVRFGIVNLFISNIHDLWMRLLLHYSGDILVFSKSATFGNLIMRAAWEIVILPSIATHHFLAAFIPSSIDGIESLHSIFALVWKIKWIASLKVMRVLWVILRLSIGHVSRSKGLNVFVLRTILV